MMPSWMPSIFSSKSAMFSATRLSWRRSKDPGNRIKQRGWSEEVVAMIVDVDLLVGIAQSAEYVEFMGQLDRKVAEDRSRPITRTRLRVLVVEVRHAGRQPDKTAVENCRDIQAIAIVIVLIVHASHGIQRTGSIIDTSLFREIMKAIWEALIERFQNALEGIPGAGRRFAPPDDDADRREIDVDAAVFSESAEAGD